MRKIQLLPFLLLAIACGDDDPMTPVDGGQPGTDAGTTMQTDGGTPMQTDGGTTMETDAGTMECTGGPATCVDEQLVMLSLFETANTSTPTTEAVGDHYRTTLDTRAGGFMPSESYLYLRFTDDGIEKVDINDNDAFESNDWDFAARRFVIRLNSGVSGPGCVTAARTAAETDFAALTSVPDGLSFREEAYFQDDCSFVSDGSGIGAPGTALSSFWTYAGCVQMTGNVYVIKLRNGRHVKLQVETYYSPEVQTQCNETGMTSQPSGSGNVQILWNYLD